MAYRCDVAYFGYPLTWKEERYAQTFFPTHKLLMNEQKNIEDFPPSNFMCEKFNLEVLDRSNNQHSNIKGILARCCIFCALVDMERGEICPNLLPFEAQLVRGAVGSRLRLTAVAG